MVIMAKISSLSPPLDFKQEGLGRVKVVTALLLRSRTVIFNKRELKRRKCVKMKDLREN